MQHDAGSVRPHHHRRDTSDYGFASGSNAIRSGESDAVAFGRPFLANPDRPARFAKNTGLNKANMATFYSSGHAGYTDYPLLDI